MQCDGGGIISQGTHSANPWNLHPQDEVGRRGRGRAEHICGVLTQVVADGELSGARVYDNSSYCGMTM